MKTYNDIVNEMLSEEGFDANNFDAGNHFSLFPSFLTKRMNPTVKAKLANNKPLTPAENAHAMGVMAQHIGAMHEGMRKGNLGGGEVGLAGVNEISRAMVESVGSQNYVIKRLNATINATLPVPLFAPNDRGANFKSFIAQYLPAGVGVTSALFDAPTGNLIIIYNDGAGGHTDTVTISLAGQNTNYSNIMSSLQNSMVFAGRLIQMTLIDPGAADISQSTEWKNVFYLGDLKSLGSKKQNELLPDALRNEYIQLKDRVSMLLPKWEVNANYTQILQMIPTAGIQVGWNMFMDEDLHPVKS